MQVQHGCDIEKIFPICVQLSSWLRYPQTHRDDRALWRGIQMHRGDLRRFRLLTGFSVEDAMSSCCFKALLSMKEMNICGIHPRQLDATGHVCYCLKNVIFLIFLVLWEFCKAYLNIFPSKNTPPFLPTKCNIYFLFLKKKKVTKYTLCCSYTLGRVAFPPLEHDLSAKIFLPHPSRKPSLPSQQLLTISATLKTGALWNEKWELPFARGSKEMACLC